MNKPEPRYLGDGVYASFDGYCIWLAVNDHTNQVVALEPDVFNQLERYKTYLKDFYAKPAVEPAPELVENMIGDPPIEI